MVSFDSAPADSRHHSDDTGSDSHGALGAAVDVTKRSWQVQSTDFWAPPSRLVVYFAGPLPWVAVKVLRSVRMSPRLLRFCGAAARVAW